MARRLLIRKDFKPTPGSRINRESTKRYAMELDRLSVKYGRMLSAKEIVLEAKDPASPLHDYFLWDRKKASEAFWLEQAQYLVRHIEVTVVDERTGKEVPTRAWYRARPFEGEPAEHAYIDVKQVLETPEFRDQILDQAMVQLDRWTRRYGHLQELFSLVGAIHRERKSLLQKLESKIMRKHETARKRKARRSKDDEEVAE